MTAITFRNKSGPDGVRHLAVPIGVAGAECEIVVVVQPGPSATGEWLPNFFERMAQGGQGEPLVRPPQGEHQVREPLR